MVIDGARRAFFAVFLVLDCGCASAATQIRVKWFASFTPNRPNARTISAPRFTSFTLSGNQVVTYGGLANGRSTLDQSSKITTSFGADTNISYKIAGGRIIQTNHADGDNYSQVISVSLSGGTGCSADVSFVKPAGARAFKGSNLRSQPFEWSAIYATDVFCTIAKVGG